MPPKAAILRRQWEVVMPDMAPVTVGRYRPGQFDGPAGSGKMDGGKTWLGWVETPDWIVWENANGDLVVINGRSETGAALDDNFTTVLRATA